MGKSQRDKGKAGERELSHELNKLLGTSCRRGVQYSGLDGDDVVGLDGFHVECKRVERLNITSATNQAAADAKNGECPILFHRTNRQPWLVTLRLDDLPTAVALISQILNKSKESKESQTVGSQ